MVRRTFLVPRTHDSDEDEAVILLFTQLLCADNLPRHESLLSNLSVVKGVGAVQSLVVSGRLSKRTTQGAVLPPLSNTTTIVRTEHVHDISTPNPALRPASN